MHLIFYIKKTTPTTAMHINILSTFIINIVEPHQESRIRKDIHYHLSYYSIPYNR